MGRTDSVADEGNGTGFTAATLSPVLESRPYRFSWSKLVYSSKQIGRSNAQFMTGNKHDPKAKK
jgi:hypothetical protein